MKKNDAAASRSNADAYKSHSGASSSSAGRKEAGLRERTSIRRDKSKGSSREASEGEHFALKSRWHADV